MTTPIFFVNDYFFCFIQLENVNLISQPGMES